MALVYQETRAEAVCSLEQDVLVLLNDKSRMKGDLHVRFREKLRVKFPWFTRQRDSGGSSLGLLTPFCVPIMGLILLVRSCINCQME